MGLQTTQLQVTPGSQVFFVPARGSRLGLQSVGPLGRAAAAAVFASTRGADWVEQKGVSLGLKDKRWWRKNPWKVFY